MNKTIVALKQAKKPVFAEFIEIKKMAFISFHLLLYKVEYKMAWRLVGWT